MSRLFTPTHIDLILNKYVKLRVSKDKTRMEVKLTVKGKKAIELLIKLQKLEALK
jgi:predicted transcriptional regulator